MSCRTYADLDCQIFEFMTATFVRKSQKHLCVQGLFILVRRPCGSIMSIGFTPTIGSANHLLQYAKEHKDATPMHEVMKLLKKNNSPLQPTTADIVFSICDDTDNWGLLTKYSKRFVRNGVNLHKAAFDIWMEFAAKVGDIESLWKIEKSRCESMKQNTVGSGFSCVKGYLLEGKPEEAATVTS